MKNISTVRFRPFTPGTLIEIDGPLGQRMLVQAADDGHAYIDLLDAPATFPIHERLHPRDAGHPWAWSLPLIEHAPEEYVAYRVLLRQLAASGYDALTVARAARWALDNHCYELNAALAEGLVQTERVRTGRRFMPAAVHH
jgi:hypothetical protein